jgi:hypothetical protein
MLEVDDCSLVRTESGGQLGLGEALGTPAGTDTLRQVGPGWLRVVAEEADDLAVVPREWTGAAGFPEVDGLLADSELPGKGSLP